MSHDLQTLLELVKDRTGYPVSVTPLAEQSSHITMRSATRETPVHAIFPNPRYERFANYLVAAQCAMLLIKWADPRGVLDFVPDEEAVAKFVVPVEKAFERHGVPPSSAQQAANSLVRGLLLQLVSSPIEILSVEWCFRECPSLRSEQQVYVMAHLRELSSTLAPDVREMTPSQIYNPTVTMNAAYTLNWAKLSGETVGLLPYEALGFKKPAEILLDSLGAIPADAPDISKRATDEWAARLNLAGLYRWSLRQT